MMNTLKERFSRVNKAAANIRTYQGTTITSSLIESSLSSWQMHLKRIAPYLVMGMGIWWSIKDGNYHFCDADNDPDNHDEGPSLLHFRDTTIDKLHKRNEELWDEIIKGEITLPTPSIKIYDKEGKLIERRTFNNDCCLQASCPKFICYPVSL